VGAAVEEGHRLGLERVFALTREPVFFTRLGFETVSRDTLPHKVWTDCVKCPFQENCDEVAMVRRLASSGA
jgi:amino-acid N-acetyltransferase